MTAPRVGAGPADVPAEERPTALRLARLHLRMGSLPLARAELESLAGQSMLDEDALLDLAEVRWRTGDVAGAGEAANALLARGRDDTLAIVIAAEAVAAEGRPGEARRLAARALEGIDGPLDPVFAGIPRSLIWPADVIAPGDLPADPGEPIAARVGPARGGAHGTSAGSLASGARITTDDPGPAPVSTGAAEAYAGGRAALGAGDGPAAAVGLGVALRLEPAFAQDVLDVIGERAIAEPALALVAGDALRLLGRETEALAAFDRARGHTADGVPPRAAPAAAAAPDEALAANAADLADRADALDPAGRDPA